MKYILCKLLPLLFFVGLFNAGQIVAQEPIENDNADLEITLDKGNTQTDSAKEDSETTSEEEFDEEATIIEPETQEAQQSVDIINSIVDIIADLEEEDSLFSHFAIYNNNNSIVEYNEYEQKTMSQKFDFVKAKDNEDYEFTFIRQTVFNANRQAWDFIYERIYNQDGKLIFFVRRYNTYNSGCAEVAFERSEYYYSEYGELAKKTYEIFDSNNNALELDDCWMERELYGQEKTYQEFISQHPLPL